MPIPMGEVPRKLTKLDEEFTSLCASVSTIKRIQQTHGERLNEHGRLLTAIRRDVAGLKTDLNGLKTEVNGKLDLILARLPER